MGKLKTYGAIVNHLFYVEREQNISEQEPHHFAAPCG
jgi:hypothetical protein